MATLSALALTYADWAKRLDEDGKTSIIIELLSQTNEILQDALVVEGNLPTGHKTTVRTGIPSATWRMLNYGVPKAKSTTAQVIDTCGMLEVYSEIDKSLADLNGNSASFRLSEDRAFLEGMSQQMATTLFYGNTAVNPERFTGLSPRYDATSSTEAQSANNFIDFGGTGSDNTSLWLVCWGADKTHMIFPKGQIAGLQHRDLGEWTLQDSQTPPGQYQGYRTHYKWDAGLTVRDWRFNVRIGNIDVSDLAAAASLTASTLINAMIRAVHRLPVQPAGAGPVQTSDAPGGLSVGTCYFYCNRTVRTYLDIQATNKTNMLLTIGEWNGKPQTMFRGIPIHTCDALVSNETRVT